MTPQVIHNLVGVVYIFGTSISFMFWRMKPASSLTEGQDWLLSALLALVWPVFLLIVICIGTAQAFRGRQ